MGTFYTSNTQYLKKIALQEKKCRKILGYSQSKMAQTAGVSLSTITSFEQGIKSNITLDTFISILRVFGWEDRIINILPDMPVTDEMINEMNKMTKRK